MGTSTEAGRLIGSASYVSPEQAQGLPLTPTSDLYSLGVVLHRLVTGRLPFEGASPIAVAVAHVTAPAPREDELAREMSPALATIVARLLRKIPAERYASATDVATALAALETRAPRAMHAWDAPTVTAERVRAPVPRAQQPRVQRPGAQRLAASAQRTGASRMARVVGIARETVTALATFVVVIAGVRVVGDHHVTANGLRHLSLRHAAHTALMELRLRPRAPQQLAPAAHVATIESDAPDGGASR